MRVTFFLCLGAFCASSCGVSAAATLEQETATRLEQLRSIQAGQSAATLEQYNHDLDAAWQFFTSHKAGVLPILRSQLKAEIAREHPSDMILMDVGRRYSSRSTRSGSMEH